MLAHEFVRHALLAGTAIGLLCGAVGWFVVVRGQVFAGDALSHVAYTAALAALVGGVDPRIGLYGGTAVVGVLLGLLGGHAADDIVIGAFFAWVLGVGVLLLSVYSTHRATTNGSANVRVLFGSIFGLDTARTALTAATCLAALAVLAVIARPLLFASVDATVAAARGVPVRLLGALFLGLVGVAAASASQAVGALLLLGLLAAPPAAARLLTARPWCGCALAAVLAAGAVWVGVTVAYAVPQVPVSTAVVSTAALAYACAAVTAVLRRRRRAYRPLTAAGPAR